MKRLFLSLTLVGSFGVAHAENSETVVHDTTTWVELDLNSQTVLCSAADYGQLFLKVGIPELARITLLDHQNVGAHAPCVAAGRCAPGNMPSDIIDPAHPTELVPIDVKAVRFDNVDTKAKTCETTLFERVHLTIRGIEFTHERSVELGTRQYQDCVASLGSAGSGSDSKADGDGSADEPKSGGCSTTSGGSSALALVGLGLVVARRRRRPLEAKPAHSNM